MDARPSMCATPFDGAVPRIESNRIKSSQAKGVRPMLSWRRDSNRGHCRKPSPLGFEPMEGRILLSTIPVVLGPQVNPFPAAVTPRNERHGLPKTAPDKPATITQQGTFAVKTAWSGYKLTHSLNVAKVGANYLKVAFAHDTTKVGAAYVRAALKGNLKTLNQLGKTDLVQKVGNAFTSLSRSEGVKKLGNSFAHFGQSVASQYKRLF
jgi:hypothetical protein